MNAIVNALSAENERERKSSPDLAETPRLQENLRKLGTMLAQPYIPRTASTSSLAIHPNASLANHPNTSLANHPNTSLANYSTSSLAVNHPNTALLNGSGGKSEEMQKSASSAIGTQELHANSQQQVAVFFLLTIGRGVPLGEQIQSSYL